jgi:hypothetical protein
VPYHGICVETGLLKHEIIPDSQAVISNIPLCALSQARMIPGSVQKSPRFESFISPGAQIHPSPTRFVSNPSKGSPKLQKSTGPYDSSVSKKRGLPQDMPAAKRHCTSASPPGRLHPHSVAPTLSSPVLRNPCSLSTPRSSPRNRLVMDCVEVMPLRELSHQRKAGAEDVDIRTQHRDSDLDDNSCDDVIPSRPFVPRVRRQLLERDEIGMALSEIHESRRRIMELTACTVPETPDAVLRPTRMSLPMDKGSSEQLPFLNMESRS